MVNLDNTNNLLTGNSKLDFEHKQIFDALNRLQDPFLSQSLRIALCEKLLHYIGDHCLDEERWMLKYDYPAKNIASHMRAHETLQDWFAHRLAPFMREGGPISEEVKVSFQNHILEYDLPMIQFLRDKIKEEEPD